MSTAAAPDDRPSAAATSARPGATRADGLPTSRDAVVAREKERFGGMKVGSAFFGWLAATGMAVVLIALLSAAGAIASATSTTAGAAAGQAAQDPTAAGIIGAVVLLVVLGLAYYCGGYVAGRMARFDGVKQGLAVWLWAVVIAVAVAVLGVVAGSRFDVLSQLRLPRIPISSADLTTGGVVTLVLAAVVTLVGAVLGGLAGMRFHRRVDRAGLGR
jgi:hypothetical protein